MSRYADSFAKRMLVVPYEYTCAVEEVRHWRVPRHTDYHRHHSTQPGIGRITVRRVFVQSQFQLSPHRRLRCGPGAHITHGRHLAGGRRVGERVSVSVARRVRPHGERAGQKSRAVCSQCIIDD